MVYLIITFVIGLIIGSFLNCLVWRLHKKQTIMGRSYCPECKHQLAWYDNIPLLSYLFLRGKCRYCQKRIFWQYPAVELVTGILFALAFYYNFQFEISNYNLLSTFNFQLSALLTLARDWFLISVMVVIFIYDLRWYLILDVVTLPAAVIILILNLTISYLQTNQCWQCIEWSNLLISGIIGGSFFLAQFVVSKGRWIGGGDIRLGLLMGLALGWPNILVALFIAYILGAVVGLGLMAAGQKQWGSKLPFGVFLASASIITLLWGDKILAWYLTTLRF